GLVYEPAWLKRHLGIDAGRDLRNFLNLRRLMRARLEAGRALCIREIYGDGDPAALHDIFSDIMSGAAKSRYDGLSFLPEFFSSVRPPFRFQALTAAPALRLFMKESFDEEWWRTEAAGDYLRGVWSAGGRIIGDSLIAECGCGDQSAETLVRDFEESFR
ncbi:MAG TPA: hypothetical protein VHC46_00905, partial [Thermodesulfobacteriota bacterium]|nr:hypothetical protein [Thermodesulfobacteriota bacterium]